jgi:hypothetical protein
VLFNASGEDASAVAADLAAHEADTANPHATTAEQVGAVATNDATYTQTVALADSAWQNPASATNWTWTSDGTQITLTGYTGPNAVVIPDTLDNLPVTGFGTIFILTAITSISGGANVTSITSSSFGTCNALTSVSLPSVTSIADSAFGNCNALTSVSLPSVTSIADSAFRICPALTSVYFGQNAPAEASDVYTDTPSVTNYVTSPTATGWGATWNGRPVVRLPGYFDSVTVGGTSLQTLLNGKQPTNSALTDLAAGIATPLIGTGATQAAAGDHGHANYVATNDAAYLAGLTNAAFAAQDGITISGRTINIGTNLLGGTGAGGITLADATNAAQTVAWTPGLTPFALTYAATVTVTRAMLATNAATLTLTTNCVLSVQTNDWTTAELGRWSLDIDKGAYSLGFDTTAITNSTVLDTTGTRVALFFRKWPGESIHRVRQ